MASKKSKSTDLQGITRLITDTTLGVTDLVEAMHIRIVNPPFLPTTPIQKMISYIAGITFDSIRWSVQQIGKSTEKTLGQLTATLGDVKATEEREAIQSALNGVIGDYLEKKENPLAIAMQFRHQAQAIVLNGKGIPAAQQKAGLAQAYPTATGKILLLIHGLCMNDIQWTRKAHNHGTALATDLDKTPIYLHYNSGRHISTNGQELSEMLDNLVQHWPVPVEELVIVAHSMGGLVSRSAFYYGQQQQKTWTKHLKKIVFLGTPHHGAPLEQAGNYLDVVLEAIPYAQPFARIGKVRSAGITDLRYGNLLDSDLESVDRFEMRGDERSVVALPAGVECYSVAAVVGKPDAVSSQLLGDGLVSKASAFGLPAAQRKAGLYSVDQQAGLHENENRNLLFKKENTWIAYGRNHMDLLSDQAIYDQIKSWLIVES